MEASMEVASELMRRGAVEARRPVLGFATEGRRAELKRKAERRRLILEPSAPAALCRAPSRAAMGVALAERSERRSERERSPNAADRSDSHAPHDARDGGSHGARDGASHGARDGASHGSHDWAEGAVRGGTVSWSSGRAV